MLEIISISDSNEIQVIDNTGMNYSYLQEILSDQFNPRITWSISKQDLTELEQVLKSDGIPYKIRNSNPLYVSSTESDYSEPSFKPEPTSPLSWSQVSQSKRTPLKQLTPPYYKPPQKAELQSKFYRHPKNDVICSDEDLIESGETIGQGAYGIVNQLGEVVKKRMDIFDKENDDIHYGNLKEICFLAQYSHGLISNIKCVEPLTISSVNLYMKFSGRILDSLTYIIEAPKVLKYLLYQLLVLFSELELMGIRHGDIKGNNIVVDDNYNVTVIDWGFMDLHPENLKYKIATSSFRAPEVSLQTHFGPINDVFALGMTILYLYNRNYLSGTDFVNYFENNEEIPDELLESITNAEILQLVRNMVKLNYKDRTPFNLLVIHPMFDEFHQGRQFQRINSYQFHIREIDDVDPDYFAMQTDINIKMREEVVDWLFDVCSSSKFQSKSAFSLCCYLIDLYLSQIMISRNNFQLLGITCLYLASLMMSTVTPEVTQFISMTANAYSLQEFLQMITEITQQFNYIIYKPRFDLEIEDVDYNIVKVLMLNHDGIGKSEDFHLQLYYKIQNNPQTVSKLVTILHKYYIPKVLRGLN